MAGAAEIKEIESAHQQPHVNGPHQSSCGEAWLQFCLLCLIDGYLASHCPSRWLGGKLYEALHSQRPQTFQMKRRIDHSVYTTSRSIVVINDMVVGCVNCPTESSFIWCTLGSITSRHCLRIRYARGGKTTGDLQDTRCLYDRVALGHGAR